MGIISNTIDTLSGKISYLQELANACDTSKLNEKMKSTVYDAFDLLKPLSKTYRVVSSVDKYGSLLAVGTWLKLRIYYQRYGTDIRNHDEFFEYIRRYGHDIARHVRKSIRDEFTSLVELTKQLKPYEACKFSLPVNKEITRINANNVTERTKKKIIQITLDTNDSYWVTLETSPNMGFRICIYYMEHTPILEDIIDELIKLYERARDEVAPIKEHNNAILEEINRLMLPRRLSKEIGS